MRKDRVKYYPSNDYLFGHNFTKIEVIEIPDFNEIDINDALEFYQISKYFDENTRCKTWSDADYETYKEKSKKLSSLTKRFFNQIQDDNVIELYNSIEFGYHSDFWALFDNCKLYNKISEETFASLIECEHIPPYDIFSCSSIVNKYGIVLREYILKNDFCISIVIHVYEQDYTKQRKLYLPIELTGDDINAYLESYIDSEHPNTNYLNDIISMGCEKQFRVTDELRLKAKRKYKLQLEEMSKTGVSSEFGFGVSIIEEQAEEKHYVNEGKNFSISYGLTYLMDSLDYPSILNNFIYIFEFVDFPQMRCTHVAHPTESGVFERITLSDSSRMYPVNFTFNSKQGLAMMQMQLYTNFLIKNGIYLEDVLHWFFTEYLQTEFGCPEIRFSMPSRDGKYSEKCQTIASAFESILKQYALYIKHGDIDFELLSMSTKPMTLDNIVGMVDKKYIYGTGKDYENISHLLFSDQCMLSFVKRLYDEGKQYNRFIKLLLNEKIYLSDYRDDESKAFEYLASYDLIEISTDGQIIPKNRVKLALLKDLYSNDAVNRRHYPPEAQDIIDEFVNKGVLEQGSTLFSKPEINYLNYLLNRSEYINGLEIRNKYIHGIQQVNNDENEHYQNYLIWLRIFVLLAIKINDDFCLNEEHKEKGV